MKLFGNDSSRPRVSRNTASFEPISEAKAARTREQARKKADRARDKAYREYSQPQKAGAKKGAAQNGARQQAQSAVRTPPAPRRRSTAKKAVIITLSVVAVILAAMVGMGFYVSGTDTIYPNVTLGGVNLGGMTLTEAAYELESSGWSNENETVSVELPMDRTLSITASEAGASVTAQQAAQTAYDYCHQGNIFTCLTRYISCLISGGSAEVEIDVDEAAVSRLVEEAVSDIMNDLNTSGVEIDEEAKVIRVVKGATNLSIDTAELTEKICTAFAERSYGPVDFTVDEESAAQLDIDSLYESVHREAVSAGYDGETDEITPSVTGVDFDKSEAQSLWNAAGLGDVVEIPAEITEPEYTTEQLEEMLFADDLGDPVVTSLSGSTANRINNVTLAAAAIDGIILAPGEQFDYNTALGERTTERGYKAAGAYSGGEVVQEVGGGICQVSSSLYYAALLANLQIDTRVCHYFGVSYLPAGLDATVSWGGPEFRFTNNREWPIKIEASVDTVNNTVTVHIVGTDTDGTYVVMEHAITGYVYGNSEYPDVATGYRPQTHRCVYAADGTLISRTTEANSEYHYHEENIVYPSPSPTPAPTPSEVPAVSESESPASPDAADDTDTEPTAPVGGEGYYFQTE